MAEKRYLAAKTVPDVWICYPWEATYVDGFILMIGNVVTCGYRLIAIGILTNMTVWQKHSLCNREITINPCHNSLLHAVPEETDFIPSFEWSLRARAKMMQTMNCH